MKTKIINFTAKEILPRLLDKTKTQTIRRAWHKKYFENTGKCTPIKPKYKVGEKVQLMWNQRSKYKWFFEHEGDPCKHEPPKEWQWSKYTNFFNKLLGIAEITEVFEIEIRKSKYPFKDGMYWTQENKKPLKSEVHRDIIDLAKRDGFKSAKEMFQWFDQRYDLSSPRKFYVYRWRYIK